MAPCRCVVVRTTGDRDRNLSVANTHVDGTTRTGGPLPRGRPESAHPRLHPVRGSWHPVRVPGRPGRTGPRNADRTFGATPAGAVGVGRGLCLARPHWCHGPCRGPAPP